MTEEVKDNTAAEPPVAEAPQAKEGPTPERHSPGDVATATINSAGKAINDAIRQMENLGKALGSALQDRTNVVMVRVNDDSLNFLDMLVEADVTKSRSESAALLINEGIKANKGLFLKIRDITDQIAALRAQLRETVQVEDIVEKQP
jgi:hypothetical protein